MRPLVVVVAAVAGLAGCGSEPERATTSASVAAPQSGAAGTISGTVHVSGGPAMTIRQEPRAASGVRVQLVDLATRDVVARATTDADGHYTLTSPATRYRLQVVSTFSGCFLDGQTPGAVAVVVVRPQVVTTQDVVCNIR